jgi:uncharacterized protein (TIGR02646 family)
MRKQDRGPKPEVLEHKEDDWTKGWVKRSAEGGKFSWPQYDRKKLNAILVPLLREQTAGHCSFCDGYPVDATSPETIEHFRPKGKDLFPELAFAWDNLFYCCQRCQEEKREQFDEKLLKPDAEGFAFAKYFVCDFTTGEIKPSPRASEVDRERARITCELYGLNAHNRPTYRRQEVRKYLNAKKLGEDVRLEDYAYRDFLELVPS